MLALETLSIFGFVAVVSLLLLSRRWARGQQRGIGVTRSTDAPARLLGWATGLMAADRAEWGQAMAGELDHVTERSQRWRFALGCCAAAFLVPPRRGTAARVVAAVIIAAVTCAGLVVYGVARYPAIITGRNTWLILITFAAVLVGLIVVTLLIVRRESDVSSGWDSASSGLVGGLLIATVWITIGVAVVGSASQSLLLVVALIVALPLAPLVLGVAAGWRPRTGAAGRRTALLAGVVAGLVLFLVVAVDALLTAGGPYDAGLVRDFPGSGLPDLATYAVSDNLGTAMNLLLVAFTVTAAIGCAGATITGWILGRRIRGQR